MQVTSRNSLGNSLHISPIYLTTRCEILNHLWDLNVCQEQLHSGEVNFDTYFTYYTEQCILALHDGGRHTAARTHKDIITIAEYLKAGQSRETIKQTLRSSLSTPRPNNEDELLNGSIDLAARLLLMMEFGGLQYGFSGQKQLQWTSGSLKEFLANCFHTHRALGQERVKLERIFNAQNLGRIARIEIVWTKNLSDHLRLLDEDRKVAIFHYAAFLECHRDRSYFPTGFIDETLRTIALLFPRSDNDVKAWFKIMSFSHQLDPSAMQCAYLRAEDRQIENFEFWHDRIVILKQFFDEAEPSTLAQWWYDRRRGVQWYTFWVAALILILTIFFGLVQSVEGALQVYKAFNPPI